MTQMIIPPFPPVTGSLHFGQMGSRFNLIPSLSPLLYQPASHPSPLLPVCLETEDADVGMQASRYIIETWLNAYAYPAIPLYSQSPPRLSLNGDGMELKKKLIVASIVGSAPLDWAHILDHNHHII
jgi:hypothetical protein